MEDSKSKILANLIVYKFLIKKYKNKAIKVEKEFFKKQGEEVNSVN